MDAEYPKCIICLKKEANTEEHLIPECIGGRFKVKILCGDCNNNLGSKLIGQIKKDPSIVYTVRNLQLQIPDIAANILDEQDYIGKDSAGQRKYNPYPCHRIYFSDPQKGEVKIGLFDWLIYRIEFINCQFNISHYALVEDLVRRKTLIMEDWHINKYCELN